MASINFPLISEITKMREEGDTVSYFFSLVCIICFALSFIFWSVYYFSSYIIFKSLTYISLSLFGICLAVVYIYRPIFLTDEIRREKGLKKARGRKYKRLDNLEGEAYEKALGKLSADEVKEYIDYPAKKIAKKITRQILKQ